MSLSFVSSAVQTVTTDGGYEETKIESKEIEEVNRRNAHKPLFEQLRANQEEDQAKQEELQREMMRGTRALDEDDVAHLDSIEQQRAEKERAIQEQTQSELSMFRAARALRQQAILGGTIEENDDDDNDHDEDDDGNNKTVVAACGIAHVSKDQNQVAKASTPIVPLIKVKKRKRRTPIDEADTTATEVQHAKKNTSELVNPRSDESKSEIPSKPSGAVSSLGDLLCGYGSSDDSN
jgi:hypothetical protein